MSVTTDTSLSEEDVDELWDTFERLTLHAQQQRKYQSYGPLRSARRVHNSSFDGDGVQGLGLSATGFSETDTDTDSAYLYSSSTNVESDSSSPRSAALYHRHSRVSAGPNGRPLVEFPVPRGPDVDALCAGGEGEGRALQDALLRGAVELRDGTRACRDLLRAMKLSEVEEQGQWEGEGELDQSTVRLSGGGSR